MHIGDFDYILPEHLIAQYPPKIRGSSRLLVLDKKTGSITHKKYSDFVDFVNAGDTVVLNDTKVIKARLLGINKDGKKREFLLLERHNQHLDTHHWKVLYKSKVRINEEYIIGSSKILIEEVLDNGIAKISSKDNLLEVSEKFGYVPLPPYMKRNSNKDDIRRYQTEFAREAGSVAAPTASLNFTNELKQVLITKGVNIAYLTLHVGIGTFLPIRTDNIEDHVMHSEYYVIPKATIELLQKTQANGNKIVAVGTTVARTLEHAQQNILTGYVQEITGEAEIFIYPGYSFKVVDVLLTNFHAPKTTVLMLAAAFAGWNNLKTAYDNAVKADYSFLSYGDSMLIS